MKALLKLRDAETEEGFTLVELMIVVVIIGILAAIAVPIFMNQQKAAHDAVVKSDLKNLALQFQTYRANKGSVPLNATELEAVAVKLSGRGNYANVNNYMLICTNSNNNYAMYATSQSGTTFVYSSATGKLDTDTTFPRSGNLACPDAGVPNTPNGFFSWSHNGNWLTN